MLLFAVPILAMPILTDAPLTHPALTRSSHTPHQHAPLLTTPIPWHSPLAICIVGKDRVVMLVFLPTFHSQLKLSGMLAYECLVG